MDCQDFEDRLDRIVARDLAPETRREAERHMLACSRCGRLYRMACGEVPFKDPGLPVDFVQSVLERTSGPACANAETLLCDWVDGSIPPEDGDMLSLHLHHCADCAALANQLRELEEELPAMADIDPDAGFLHEVMLNTALRHSEGARDRLASAIAAGWRQLVRRRRFAWEAAYVGALLFLLILGSPAESLPAISGPSAVPGLLAHGRDQIVLETRAVLNQQQETAERVLTDLRRRGEEWLAAADRTGNRATTAVREQAASLFATLRLALFDDTDSGKQQEDAP
jgi:anti-sigma factor RsiW